MSLLVKDFLNRKGRKGDLGLELEVEADAELPLIKDDFWTTKQENSLRASFNAEYISNGPLTLVEANKGIRSLCYELQQKKYRVIQDSPRTSFHVHSNMLYRTPVQYWNSVVAYWLLEDLLFDYFEPERKGNCFCLRLTDAEGVLHFCFRELRAEYPFRNLNTENIRYAGQNLASTPKFGTIERRGMDGRIDPARLQIWTTALAMLDSRVLEFENPSSLLDSYLKKDGKETVNMLVGEAFAQKILVGSWKDRLQESAATVEELAYFHDWKAWQEKINKFATDKVRELYAPRVVEFTDTPPETIGGIRVRQRIPVNAR